jgi:electron transport complex protein RnfB
VSSTDLCTGCELCIPPCPVDCIDLVEDTQPYYRYPETTRANDLRQRYYAHIQREEQQRLTRKGPIVRAEIDTELFAQFSSAVEEVPVIKLIEDQAKIPTTLDAKTTIELANTHSNQKAGKTTQCPSRSSKTAAIGSIATTLR